MNWSYKFAFDEVEKMLENRPWVLVDNDFSSADNDEFLGVQKELLVQRGWDWFKNTIRGRFFPNLNLTTMTTWEGERNPQQGDPDPGLISKIQQKFPDVSIVSLIGEPHVVTGPPVSQNILSQVSKVFACLRWKQQLNKTAMKVETDFDVPYYKDEFQFEIADVDRYATDKYFANLTLQETKNLYSIGFQMYNYQVGLTGSVQYWHYELSELERAKKTFKKIKSALIKTMSDIEYNRPPMAVITPMIRSALQSIDVGRKERSGNYFHNWFDEMIKEPDWRTSIYGNRYPEASIQYIDAFWNTDDVSKEVTVEGTSSRSRILQYKPFQETNEKYAANYERLRQLWANRWGVVPAAGASGAVLGWLLTLMSPAQLEQQLEQGATPQDIISQVAPENPPEELDNSPEAATIPQLDARNMDGLDPMFSQKVLQILHKLAEKGWKPRVAEGLRTIEQQQEKIDLNRSSLKDPNNSKHVQGLAVDIIDSRYGWSGPASDLNFQFWSDLGEAAKEVGCNWGGDWKSFKDVAHVEN